MVEPHEGENRRVLVVDDNKAIHDDYRKVLGARPEERAFLEMRDLLFDDAETKKRYRRLAFELDSAFQGHEAVEMVREACAQGRPYTVALVDVRMPPGIDGIETVERLWKIDPNLQVVLCSAFSDYSLEDIHERLTKIELLLILKKPFEPIVIKQMTESLNRRWILSQKLRSEMEEADHELRRLRSVESAARPDGGSRA
jgi:CheY-like chemotaxis protein